LFVTALNLLPIGQLDGGHVAYALLGRRAWKLAYVMVGALGALGLYLYVIGNPAWPTWVIWAGLALLMGPRHPPPLNDASRLGRRRTLLGILLLLVFILTFVPVPIVFGPGAR
jgi:membrane-associated protease RseP (regulator of RpoE activity)